MLRLYARLRLVWSLWEEVGEFTVLNEKEVEGVLGGTRVEVDRQSGEGRVVGLKEMWWERYIFGEELDEEEDEEDEIPPDQPPAMVSGNAEMDASSSTSGLGGGDASTPDTVDEGIVIKPDMKFSQVRPAHRDMMRSKLSTTSSTTQPAIHGAFLIDCTFIAF